MMRAFQGWKRDKSDVPRDGEPKTLSRSRSNNFQLESLESRVLLSSDPLSAVLIPPITESQSDAALILEIEPAELHTAAQPPIKLDRELLQPLVNEALSQLSVSGLDAERVSARDVEIDIA